MIVALVCNSRVRQNHISKGRLHECHLNFSDVHATGPKILCIFSVIACEHIIIEYADEISFCNFK